MLKYIKYFAKVCSIHNNYIILHLIMKKLLHIALTLVLTMTLLVMGSGVTFRHCLCSGKTTMTLGNATQGDEDTESSNGCMTIATVSLSPTTQMHPMAFDFHAFLPLVAIINNWHIISLLPQEEVTARWILPKKAYSPPPRQYLHILRVLTL